MVKMYSVFNGTMTGIGRGVRPRHKSCRSDTFIYRNGIPVLAVANNPSTSQINSCFKTLQEGEAERTVESINLYRLPRKCQFLCGGPGP